MAFQTPKTDWTSADGVMNTDFNRIEGNTQHNHDMADDNRSVIVATGTGTAIALTIPTFEIKANRKFTFRTIAGNAGAATTISINGTPGIPLYKEGTTITPVTKDNKTYSAYIKSDLSAAFLLASAEGDALASHVLAPKTFSNGDDTGIVGTMPHRSGITDNNGINVATAGHIRVKPQLGYYDGTNDYVDLADPDFVSSDIPSDKNFFGLQGSMQSYTSWQNIGVNSCSSVVNKQSQCDFGNANITVGCGIKWVGTSATSYGVVTAVSGTNCYVWWSNGGLPSGFQANYFCDKGCYPSDFPDITFDNWGYTFSGSQHTVTDSGWTRFESFTMPYGTFNVTMSYYGGYYWDDAQFGSTQCISPYASLGVSLYPQLPQNYVGSSSLEVVSTVISCNGDSACYTAIGSGVHPSRVQFNMALMPTFNS